MKPLLALLALLAALPVSAEDFWILQKGPEAVESIPLVPLQPVPGWRGLYSDGEEQVWIYATASAHFFPPAAATVRKVPGTAWSVAFFFPPAWKPAAQAGWQDRWVVEFLTLHSLPGPGWPITLPSVLRKG